MAQAPSHRQKGLRLTQVVQRVGSPVPHVLTCLHLDTKACEIMLPGGSVKVLLPKDACIATTKRIIESVHGFAVGAQSLLSLGCKRPLNNDELLKDALVEEKGEWKLYLVLNDNQDGK